MWHVDFYLTKKQFFNVFFKFKIDKKFNGNIVNVTHPKFITIFLSFPFQCCLLKLFFLPDL